MPSSGFCLNAVAAPWPAIITLTCQAQLGGGCNVAFSFRAGAIKQVLQLRWVKLDPGWIRAPMQWLTIPVVGSEILAMNKPVSTLWLERLFYAADS